MLEIEKLEKEWRIYKLKRLKPLLFISLGIVAAAGIYLVMPKLEISNVHMADKAPALSPKEVNTTAALKKPKQRPAETKKVAIQTQEPITAPTTPQTQKTAVEQTVVPITPIKSTKTPLAEKPESKQSTVMLTPETDFLNAFETGTPTSHSSTRIHSKSVSPVREEVITTESAKPLAKKTTENESIQKESSLRSDSGKSTLMVETKTSNNTLKYLIERFNEKRDPKLAAYIAQSYYKKKDYNEAVKWSIMANSLDPSDEGSWLLYAKSKVRLGKKQDAIQALKTYLNQYSSPKVKAYLHNLEHSL